MFSKKYIKALETKEAKDIRYLRSQIIKEIKAAEKAWKDLPDISQGISSMPTTGNYKNVIFLEPFVKCKIKLDESLFLHPEAIASALCHFSVQDTFHSLRVSCDLDGIHLSDQTLQEIVSNIKHKQAEGKTLEIFSSAIQPPQKCNQESEFDGIFRNALTALNKTVHLCGGMQLLELLTKAVIFRTRHGTLKDKQEDVFVNGIQFEVERWNRSVSYAPDIGIVAKKLFSKHFRNLFLKEHNYSATFGSVSEFPPLHLLAIYRAAKAIVSNPKGCKIKIGKQKDLEIPDCFPTLQEKNRIDEVLVKTGNFILQDAISRSILPYSTERGRWLVSMFDVPQDSFDGAVATYNEDPKAGAGKRAAKLLKQEQLEDSQVKAVVKYLDDNEVYGDLGLFHDLIRGPELLQQAVLSLNRSH